MIHSNKKSQFSGFKSPSKVSLVRSKSTDHITSTHKSIAKKQPIIVKSQNHDTSVTKAGTMPKTKSMKSLKSKLKSLPKNSQSVKSTKKIKPKTKKNTQNSQSDTKTVKKSKNIVKTNILSQESFNSLQSGKMKPLQYFLYQNTYIAIQNSAQRRLVLKIKQVDKKIQQTTDTFFKKTYQSSELIKNEFLQEDSQKESSIPLKDKDYLSFNHEKLEMKDCEISTEKFEIVQYGTNTTPRIETQLSIQTQHVRFQEDVTKCFSQTLNDIEFLFLPDEKNFQGFSKPQRVHYRELFQCIAQKIWTNGQSLQQLTEQKLQLLIYQRQCIQMGMIQYFPQEGFPTHVYAVMSYLTNLFSYTEIHHKYEVLDRIHNIYGYAYQQRFTRLVRGLPTKKQSHQILDQEIFLALENELFKDHFFGDELLQKSVHIHNKVLFDAANEQLQKFKPFYYSKGEPFPWFIDIGMTFFSIDEDTISLLLKQIREKLLVKFGYLCGLLVDYDNFKETPNKEKLQLHIKKLEQQQLKMIQDDVLDNSDNIDIEEQTVLTKCDISTWILAQIIEEICFDLLALENKEITTND